MPRRASAIICRAQRAARRCEVLTQSAPAPSVAPIAASMHLTNFRRSGLMLVRCRFPDACQETEWKWAIQRGEFHDAPIFAVTDETRMGSRLGGSLALPVGRSSC